MGSDIPYTFKHTKFSRITKFWRCRYLRVRYWYFWLGTAAVLVAEYIEKDFLPVLQQVEKKKQRSSRSWGRVSLTRLTVSLQQCVHTHELYRFGLYTCKYSVQYYLGTSTAALARALAATIGIKDPKSPGAHSHRLKSHISAVVKTCQYSSQILSICTNYSVLEKF